MGDPFYSDLLSTKENEMFSGSGSGSKSTDGTELTTSTATDNSDSNLTIIIGASVGGISLLILVICLSVCVCLCCAFTIKVYRKKRRENVIENMPKFRVLDAPNPSFNTEGSGEHIPLTDSTHYDNRSPMRSPPTRKSNTMSSSEYSYASPNEFRVMPSLGRNLRSSSGVTTTTEEYMYAKSEEDRRERAMTLPTSPPRVASPYSIPLEISGKYGSVASSPPQSPSSPQSTVSSVVKRHSESSPPTYAEGHYMTPATDQESLYAQIKSLSVKQISRRDIVTQETIGIGNFGLVCKGLWNVEPDPEPVALKTLKTDKTISDIIKFLQEAAIMGQFHHPNVVELHGVVTIGEPIMIVLELMELGDLKQFLIKKKEQSIDSIQQMSSLLLSFCCQIASGMDYLSKKCFVHRDLAARNIFVRNDLSCKIGDFGLARDLMDEEYYISTGGKIPIKWTAPEALIYRKYSSASDVWSYGVLLYEVWGLGIKPFKGRTNQETLRLIEDGYRLPPPPGCPRSIYEIMIICWNPEYTRRPTFEVVHSMLQCDEMTLLYWADEDKAVHPEVTSLGSDPSISTSLYLDLQMIYKSE